MKKGYLWGNPLHAEVAVFTVLAEKARLASLIPVREKQIINEKPEELKEAQIQRFLADLSAISHFCKVFRVGQK